MRRKKTFLPCQGCVFYVVRPLDWPGPSRRTDEVRASFDIARSSGTRSSCAPHPGGPFATQEGLRSQGCELERSAAA